MSDFLSKYLFPTLIVFVFVGALALWLVTVATVLYLAYTAAFA